MSESSDSAETLMLRDVRRLNLNEGDTLVVLLEQKASQSAVERIEQMMRTSFPDHKCLVLDAGTDLAVASPEP